MQDQQAKRQGIFDAAARVLAEVLKTPRIRQSVRIVLNNLDPENAAAVVRAATQTDPELFLSALGSLPAFSNACLAANAEGLDHARNFAPALLAEQAALLLEETDVAQLGANLASTCALILSVVDRPDRAVADALDDARTRFAAGFAAQLERDGLDAETLVDAMFGHLHRAIADPDSTTSRAVNRVAVGLGELIRQNPAVVENVVKPLAEAASQIRAKEAADD